MFSVVHWRVVSTAKIILLFYDYVQFIYSYI